jgi:metal-dependent amidase/aminoacylase/carboxypeptidase family protein
MLKDRIDTIVNGIAPSLIELRRKIHEHPELAF